MSQCALHVLTLQKHYHEPLLNLVSVKCIHLF